MTVYGVTLKDDTDRQLKNFASIMGVKPTPALALIAERYFAMTHKEREAIEKRLEWQKHRNRGYRSLNHFGVKCPKQKTKAHVLPSTLPPPTRKTAQSSFENIDV